MKRAHKLQSSQDIVFVDTTSCCDSEDHYITFVLTPCAAGAVPLGIIITKQQSYNAYVAGFRLLKGAFKPSFNGKGFPNIFLTDQSEAEITAFETVWPESTNLLCIFHVLQAVWRWLWDSKHGIPKQERPRLMASFQNILYSTTKDQANEAFNEANKENGEYMYSNWKKYITDYWKIRAQWCLAWRNSTSKGHHTNNFSEACVRLFKDNVLFRVKAYNVIALLDFTYKVLEKYYCHRLVNFANNRSANPRLCVKAMLKKTVYLKKDDIIRKSNEEYEVPSEKNPSIMYSVNMKFGCCSCKEGLFGKFCKHQCSIYNIFNISPSSLPPVTAQDRYSIAQLALGDKVPPPSFYQPLLLEKNLKTPCNSSNTENNSSNTEELSSVLEASGTGDISEPEDDKFHIILEKLKKAHENLGLSLDAQNNFIKRFDKITTREQLETFFKFGNSHLHRRDGTIIKVQPTSKARRSVNVTKGNKRLPSGLPAGEKKNTA